MELTRGANTRVAASAVSVVLEWGSGQEVDPQALLLAETGKIRSDDDFVFFNAPRHPSGAIVLQEVTAGRAVLAVDLRGIESGVDRVVIAGSVPAGSFREIPGLALSVQEAGRPVLRYPVSRMDAVQAMVLGEFYRRAGGWRFRAVGQGWDSGLRGLAEEFGVTVDDDPTPSPEVSAPSPVALSPGWYEMPEDPGRLRWWSGTAWTEERWKSHPPHDPAAYGRILETWRGQAWQVLTATGPRGPRWDELWTMLRYHMISDVAGREALRPLALAHLERVVAFAFADNEIEQRELDDFDRTVAELHAAADLSAMGRPIEQLRQRMLRGRALTQVKAGELPRVHRPDLHLEADELLHVDVNAVQIRNLASGPKHSAGRLIGSSKKLRFIGTGAGSESTWSKIVSIQREYDTVVIAATTAKGGGRYRVPDAEYVAAVLEGTLRVAKRLVLAPGERDSRAIPQHVKSRVWQRDAGKCVECGAQEYLEFDHIIPWSRGGATSVDNLQILCRHCNLAKGARM
ncbi:TerD family protein [Nocardia sp. JMUB6875]|uniref:TerD family protein n=1 Tax=Nocardia sp. JMUB6875 TaxID=3158170 RepID=UPI0032E78978